MKMVKRSALSSLDKLFGTLPGTAPVEKKEGVKATIVGTEDWAGERLAEFLAGRAYWLEASGRWIMWDGKKWNMEAGALLMGEALQCARDLSAEGVKQDDKAITGSIKARHSARGAEAVPSRKWWEIVLA